MWCVAAPSAPAAAAPKAQRTASAVSCCRSMCFRGAAVTWCCVPSLQGSAIMLVPAVTKSLDSFAEVCNLHLDTDQLVSSNSAIGFLLLAEQKDDDEEDFDLGDKAIDLNKKLEESKRKVWVSPGLPSNPACPALASLVSFCVLVLRRMRSSRAHTTTTIRSTRSPSTKPVQCRPTHFRSVAACCSFWRVGLAHGFRVLFVLQPRAMRTCSCSRRSTAFWTTSVPRSAQSLTSSVAFPLILCCCVCRWCGSQKEEKLVLDACEKLVCLTI